MNVSSWSINNPIPACLLFMLLTIVGLASFNNMKIQSMPDVEFPAVSISAKLQGAAPSQIETDIVRKLENAVASIQDVKHIATTIQDDVATIIIEFRIEKTIQEAMDDTRDAVARIRSDLPAEMNEPIITKLDIASMPVLVYAVHSTKMDEQALSWFVDNDITKMLLNVKGVGSVSRVGGVTRQINVELSPERLLALQISAADISRQLRLTQQEASAGRSDIGYLEQRVRTLATVNTVDELAQMNVLLSDGRQIRLNRIATVSDSAAEQRSAAFLNGKPVVAFEVSRTKGGSEVDIMHRVREQLSELQKQYPDVEITEAFNFVDPIVENYDGSMHLLYEGALLAIIVVWLFLRNWRATFVAAVALPLSIIPTFAIMYMMGFTLNTVTLLSLSLVVGILVDDAIVEIENIMRHLSMGKTPIEAAREAADEIGLAVIATTFTLIAVFLPTAFMSGIVGRFFIQFGWTAAIAIFFSLVVARLLTPMMAAYMLKSLAQEHRQAGWERGFSRASNWCMRNRLKTAVATMVFFFGVLFGLGPLLPTGFSTPDDLSQTQVNLTLPPGSRFEQTLDLTKQAEAIIKAHPHVQTIYTTIGGGTAGSHAGAALIADPSQATLTLNLSPRQERSGITKQQIEAQLREQLAVLPGVRLKVALVSSTEKYEIALTGDNSEALLAHAQQLIKEIRSIPGIGYVTSSANLMRSEVIIRPDFARAADLGVTTEAIADTLRVATIGDYDQALAKLNLNERQIPIVVKLEDKARQNLTLLSRLTVPGAQGPVMLANVATITVTDGVDQIRRYDRHRTIDIEVELNELPLGEVDYRVNNLPSMQQLPAGIYKAQMGEAELMTELMTGFVIAMGTGVLCIFIVLVLLFKDFMQPITILAALVLSVPGAVLSLFLTQKALSMPAMLGLIMLMGVATKNSILLVEYAIKARAEMGMTRFDALIDAGKKRVRPIVMTTLAMGGGMLPIALGIGVDPSFRAPMAIVVIGGLITSTFLSLIVIPVIFIYIDDMRLWGLHWVKRLRRH